MSFFAVKLPYLVTQPFASKSLSFPSVASVFIKNHGTSCALVDGKISRARASRFRLSHNHYTNLHLLTHKLHRQATTANLNVGESLTARQRNHLASFALRGWSCHWWRCAWLGVAFHAPMCSRCSRCLKHTRPSAMCFFNPLRSANARRLAGVQAKRFAHHAGAYIFCWRVQLATCADERLRLKNELR